jgi:2-dehydropantoate 2-reductase
MTIGLLVSQASQQPAPGTGTRDQSAHLREFCAQAAFTPLQTVTMSPMRHVILGAGGVGGLIGAVSAHAGENVSLSVRPGTDSLYPPELSLDSRFGQFAVPVSVITKIQQPLEILWITVKATQLEAALENIDDRAKIDLVVPLLNGIDHVERLRKRFGDERVIPATIAGETERITPGKIVHRSSFIRFKVARQGQGRLESPIDIFERFGFDCQVLDDERTLLWAKLVFLAPLALSTSVARGPLGEVMSKPVRAAGLEQCLREACAVAAADGAKVNAETVLAIIKALPLGTRSSMEKDIARGNRPELDAIAGPIIRRAGKYGIAVPKTAELMSLVAKNSALANSARSSAPITDAAQIS